MTKEEIQEKLRKQDDTVFEELITVDDLDFQGELDLKEIIYTESLLEG